MAIPDNVANPSLYKKAKAKAKEKFDVYPSAYANGWMVQEYKRMGGKYKADGGIIKKRNGGGVHSFIARGCGKVMNDRRKQTKMRIR
ncbi:MAG: DUF5872 domain-containing protein [Methylophilaceae bacterium]|jgi:hypothetical protein